MTKKTKKKAFCVMMFFRFSYTKCYGLLFNEHVTKFHALILGD